MTNRYYALTLILEKDVREDDASSLIEAVKMMKGVLDVKPHITDPTTWMAEERARRDLGVKLWEILYPKQKEKNDN